MTSSNVRRILVTYGSTREGTAGIATAMADTLRTRDIAVDCLAADAVRSIDDYDAVVVGGALYMARWHRAARRFVARFASQLRVRPVWLFSSGPLDASASTTEIAPVAEVASLMKRIGARGHATFGGRLAPGARGFIASSMARTRAGDWRDWDAIRAWTDRVADVIATAPRPVALPAPSPARWLLATLCLLVGVTAVLGGLALVLRPDGSLLQMPISYLEHTSWFADFLVPGILLLVVVGFGHLFAGALVLRRSEHADLAALIAGGVLTLWIVAEMLLLGTMNGLQIAMLAIATATIGEALRRLSRTRPTTPLAA